MYLKSQTVVNFHLINLNYTVNNTSVHSRYNFENKLIVFIITI